MKQQTYEEIDIKKLKYCTWNPRKIATEDLDRLKNSIREFGQVQTLVIDENNIVLGGNQRLKALRELTYTGNIKVIRLTGYSEAEKKAINLALNKISGEWNNNLLAGLLQEIKLEGMDWTLSGFSMTDLQELNITFEDLDLKKLFSESDYDDLIDGTQGRKSQIEGAGDFCTCPTCGHRHKKE